MPRKLAYGDHVESIYIYKGISDHGFIGQMPLLLDQSHFFLDESRLLLDQSSLLLDESRLLLDQSRLLSDESRLLLDGSRLLLDQSRLLSDRGLIFWGGGGGYGHTGSLPPRPRAEGPGAL